MPKPQTMKFLAVLFLAALTCSLAAAQKAPTFTQINVPGATETDANGINTNGVIVGAYFDSSGIEHAFQRTGTRYKKLDVPGSTGTLAYGINDAGVIVGWYFDASGVAHGFSYNGSFTTIDPPGSTLTNAWSINTAGNIVGTYTDASGLFHGFTLQGTNYTTFDAPGGSLLTEFTGINNHNQRVGIYFDSAGVQHGFTLAGGTFTDVTAPGAGVVVTATDRINDTNEIVGLFGLDTAGPFTGYSRNAAKQFHPITVPGSTETRCRGLNNGGAVVGRFTDSGGVIHGFMMTP